MTDLPQTYQDGQKVLITDFNQDQIDDLLIYGHNRLIALKGTGVINTKMSPILYLNRILGMLLALLK